MANSNDTDSSSRSRTPGPLSPEALYKRCDPGLFEFDTTAELEDLDVTVGQTRALAALDFGVRMRAHGYNLFVLGRTGSQRHRIVAEYLKTHAPDTMTPWDWCHG